MSEMTRNKCLTCGGDLFPDGHGVPTCDHCGRQYPDATGSFSHELTEIAHRRQLREFIQAEELCRELQLKQPESSEVYWQTLLATLGVVYVQEESKAKPTFFSYSYDDRESILDNENYKKAIQYASSESDRRYYESHANELDRLLKDFFSLVAKEDSYDIFISFKRTVTATVGNEERQIDTDDYIKAEEIYNHLSKKYRVFFSPVSIGKDTGIEGEKYEPRILKALQTSQAMVLLGSRKEYLESQWVQNEWRRFKYFIDKGKKGKASIILGYEKNMPGLPVALKDIQLPSFDWYKNNYIQELESKLTFVRSSKGIKSSLKNRKISSDFGTDTSFNVGYSGKRIAISGKSNTGIVISASEERELDFAEKTLQSRHFDNAKMLFSNILIKNQNSAKAYWGRFKASIRATTDDDVPRAITAKDTEAYFDDIDSAIDCSNDEQFSWSIVDILIKTLNTNVAWSKRKKVFDRIIKFLDDKRIDKVLKTLSDAAFACLDTNVNTAAEIFESSRQLFFEENKKQALSHIRKFADGLYNKLYFDKARKYYEELASAQKDAEVYLRLLGCRIKAADVTQAKFVLKVNTEDDASTKKPAELDLDEILERAIICTTKSNSEKIDSQIQKIILFQVMHNRSNIKPFIETAVSCYVSMDEEEKAIKLLLSVSELLIQVKKFKQAQEYYNEVLSRNPNCSQAHWGLLMCRFKVISEVQLAKRSSKLLNLPEYTNAISCASEAEFRHYTDILNGQVSSGSGKTGDKVLGLNQQAYYAYKLKRNKRMNFISLLVVLPLAAFGVASVILAAFGVNVFYAFWASLMLSLFDNPYFMYIFLGAFVLIFIIVLVVRSKYARGLRSFVVNVFFSVLILSVAGYGFVAVRAADTEDSKTYVGDGFVVVYSENSTGYTVDKVYYSGIETNIVLPSEHHGKPITALGENILGDNLGKVRLTLPETITYIEGKTFKNSENLISIDIPLSVEYIEEAAFKGCGYLESMSLPFVGGGAEIENDLGTERVFGPNRLFGYIFGTVEYENSGLVSQYYDHELVVGNYVPSALKRVTVKAGEIGFGAFSGCKNLTDITLEDSVTSIELYAFRECSKLKSVKIGDSVTRIGNSAFFDCGSLTSVKIGSSVTEIGRAAFERCTGLKRIVIPNTVTSIEMAAFLDCNNLESITLPFIGAASSGTENTNFGYIFGFTDNKRIPTSLQSVTVSGGAVINSYAFAGCEGLKKITVSDTVTTIGNNAFEGCTALTSIEISDSVTSIGTNAFKDCNELLQTQNGVLYADKWAVGYNASLIYATLRPDTVGIADAAFFGCSELMTIDLPSTLKSIGQFAFNMCGTLQRINIPNAVTSIQLGTFAGCGKLGSVDLGGVKYIGDYAFQNCASLTSVEIKNTVTKIGDTAFSGCKGLTSIVIPSSVTEIGKGAFQGCYGLTSITVPFVGATLNGTENTSFKYIFGNVPDSLKTVVITGGTAIADNAFQNCDGISSITLPATVTSIGNNAFYYCGELTEMIIPNSVKNIGESAFRNCSNLSSLTIGSGVVEIGRNAFYGCRNLSAVTIPNSVTTIGEQAFVDCKLLTQIVIPGNVTSIGEQAFRGCDGLESIAIPFTGAAADATENTHFGYIFGTVPAALKTVTITAGTAIEDGAFSGCAGLTSIKLPETLTRIGNHAFYGCAGLAELIIPDSVAIIGKGAFDGCESLQFNNDENGVYLGNAENPYLVLVSIKDSSVATYSVNKKTAIIGGGAFASCSELTDVQLPDGLIGIGDGAFSACTALAEINIPNSVTAIGSAAFSGCTALASIKLPDSITAIEDNTFENCAVLTSIEIPDSVTRIGKYAFSGCRDLTSIQLSKAITTIGDNAFEDCVLLTEITIPESVVTIGNEAFKNNLGLTAIIIPKNVTVLGKGAFNGCVNLAEVKILGSIAEIGEATFYNCKALTDIVIPNSVTSIGASAFRDCIGLTDIVIPDSVTVIENGAFSGCSGLTDITLPFVGGSLAAEEASESTLFGYIFGGSNFTGGASTNQHYSDRGSVNYCIPTSLVNVTITGGNLYYGAFYNCFKLMNIKLPDSITSIPSCAFYNCSSLLAVEMPAKVTQIGSKAFALCYLLPSVTIPSTVTEIAENVFLQCTSLTEITIPNSVTSIAAYAFRDCKGLTEIVVPNSVTVIGNGAFSGCSGLTGITLPFVGGSATATEPGASTLLGYIFGSEFYDGGIWTAQKYGTWSYSYKDYYIPSSLKKVTVTGGELLYGAFYQCNKIESVVIPKTITTISDSVFYGCSSLTELDIPNTVTAIGHFAFYQCKALKRIELPSRLTSIGNWTFYECKALTDVVIPNSVTNIGDYAFALCSGLTSVEIPNSVTRINDYAFSGCTSLTSVKFNGTIKEWENIFMYYSWRSDSAITTVVCYDGTITL